MSKNVSLPALVTAGFAAVEERGLAGLTMRDVAQRLGVQAPAIYWHVKGRAELIDEMATEMWRCVHRSVAEQISALDRLEALAVFAREVRRQALSRRDGAQLMAGTRFTDDALLREQQAPLAELDPDDARALINAYQVIYSFVSGYAIEEQARLADPEAYDPKRRAERLGDDDPARSELVLATGDDRFEELLGLVLSAFH